MTISFKEVPIANPIAKNYENAKPIFLPFSPDQVSLS
jgi:hypothetical protein